MGLCDEMEGRKAEEMLKAIEHEGEGKAIALTLQVITLPNEG